MMEDGFNHQMVTVAECRDVFKCIPCLHSLHNDDVTALSSMMHSVEMRPGTILFYEDDDADMAYFICHGAVEVFKSDRTGKKLPLMVMRDGGVVGEMGLLTNEPRTATARTLTSTRFICLPKEKFCYALANDSLAAYHMVLAFAQVVANRLSHMDNTFFYLYQKGIDCSSEELDHVRSVMLSSWTS